MKVLVTGASGLIGAALCDSLLAREDEVVGLSRNPAKARSAGMSVTPLRQTVADVLKWDHDRGEPELSIGLTPEQ